jgi:hypothetical protein
MFLSSYDLLGINSQTSYLHKDRKEGNYNRISISFTDCFILQTLADLSACSACSKNNSATIKKINSAIVYLNCPHKLQNYFGRITMD